MPVSIARGLLTPVEKIGNLWLKRDDLWVGDAPATGGKARTASVICQRAKSLGITEICAALDRNSSVPGMLSRVCKHYGIGLHLWIPAANTDLPPMFAEAKSNGAVLEEIRPGYMSVRRKRLRDYVAANNRSVEIGVGLLWDGYGNGGLCGNDETAFQATNVQRLVDTGEVKRVVVPVGSGGMLRGIASGLKHVHILGVCCGNVPDMFFPSDVELVKSPHEFAEPVEEWVGNLILDPIYEAKCLAFTRDGDLLWIVAHRDTE